jgi:hypothetical protein
VDDYVAKLHETLCEVHTLGRKSLKKCAEYRKKHYDQKARRRSLSVGQMVWMHDLTRKVGVCPKFTSRWKGPFVIVKKIDDLVYLVKKTPKQLAKAVHIDRLKSYHGKTIPAWIKRLRRTLTAQNNDMEH